MQTPVANHKLLARSTSRDDDPSKSAGIAGQSTLQRNNQRLKRMFVTPRTKSHAKKPLITRDKDEQSTAQKAQFHMPSKSRSPNKNVVFRTHLRALERTSIERNCNACLLKESNTTFEDLNYETLQKNSPHAKKQFKSKLKAPTNVSGQAYSARRQSSVQNLVAQTSSARGLLLRKMSQRRRANIMRSTDAPQYNDKFLDDYVKPNLVNLRIKPNRYQPDPPESRNSYELAQIQREKGRTDRMNTITPVELNRSRSPINIDQLYQTEPSRQKPRNQQKVSKSNNKTSSVTPSRSNTQHLSMSKTVKK